MTWLLTPLCLIGLAALYLSMKRHFNQWFPDKSLSKQLAITIRLFGYLLLLIALIIASQIYGFGLASTLFFGLLSPLILLIALVGPIRNS